jgi:hypothetical protein
MGKIKEKETQTEKRNEQEKKKKNEERKKEGRSETIDVVGSVDKKGVIVNGRRWIIPPNSQWLISPQEKNTESTGIRLYFHSVRFLRIFGFSISSGSSSCFFHFLSETCLVCWI